MPVYAPQRENNWKMRNACQRLSSISNASPTRTDVFLMKMNISQQMSVFGFRVSSLELWSLGLFFLKGKI